MVKKQNKSRYILILSGLLLFGFFLPMVIEPIIYDAVINKGLTSTGFLKSSLSSLLVLTGFILAHRGFTGDWL